MKKYSWLIAIVGVAALGLAVIFGAAFGAGITYFLLQADPVQAALTAPVEIGNEEGVLISSIKPDSAAAQAGLVRGDIILEVNGEPVNSTIELKTILSEIEPGDSVEMTVLHGDETRILEAKLDNIEGIAFLGVGTCDFATDSQIFPGGSMKDIVVEAIPLGAEVVEVVAGSPAEDAGLQVGDVILRVNEDAIGPESGLADLIQAYQPGEEITLLVQSPETDEPRELTVTLGENPKQPGQAYLGVAYQMNAAMGFGMDKLPFDQMPEGWDGSEGMPKFFFHHEDKFDGELPQGDEEGGEFFFHSVPGMPEGEGMPHFFDLGELPEGVEGAVIVSEVLEDTPAAEVGLQPGDLIIAIDGEAVTEIEIFVELLQSHQPGDEVTLTIFRNGEESQVAVTLAEHPDNPEHGFLGVMAGTFMLMENLELPEGFDQNFELELPGVPGGDA